MTGIFPELPISVKKQSSFSPVFKKACFMAARQFLPFENLLSNPESAGSGFPSAPARKPA
jgi:hypothetical protein